MSFSLGGHRQIQVAALSSKGYGAGHSRDMLLSRPMGVSVSIPSAWSENHNRQPWDGHSLPPSSHFISPPSSTTYPSLHMMPPPSNMPSALYMTPSQSMPSLNPYSSSHAQYAQEKANKAAVASRYKTIQGEEVITIHVAIHHETESRGRSSPVGVSCFQFLLPLLRS